MITDDAQESPGWVLSSCWGLLINHSPLFYKKRTLGFLVFTQDVVASGVTVAGGPIHRSIGVLYTLTTLDSFSATMAPFPTCLASTNRISASVAIARSMSTENDVFMADRRPKTATGCHSLIA